MAGWMICQNQDVLLDNRGNEMKRTIAVLSLLTVAVLMISVARADNNAQPTEIRFMQWSGVAATVEKPETSVIKNDTEWSKIWSKTGEPVSVPLGHNQMGVAVFSGVKD